MHVTGTHIAYFHICKRKLWLFDRGIQMEHVSDRVRLGKQINQETYEREKKEFLIDGKIAIDHIKDSVIHEVKKSNKVEYAHKAQLLYYLWVLEQKGNQSFVGQLDYPLLKTSKKIKLTEQNRKKMTSWIKQI
ncbi:MAG: CRISPR-associated protein Cas4, partial [Patescibacteria group bacterium]|nr:CRISPR-associated protein Cas4 [Patescibacteria group bacterium]